MGKTTTNSSVSERRHTAHVRWNVVKTYQLQPFVSGNSPASRRVSWNKHHKFRLLIPKVLKELPHRWGDA